MTEIDTHTLAAGDTVTAEFHFSDGDIFTITGKVKSDTYGALHLAGWSLALNDGAPSGHLACVISRIPVEPPVGTVIRDDDDDYWVHLPNGWACIEGSDKDDVQPWAAVTSMYPAFEVIEG